MNVLPPYDAVMPGAVQQVVLVGSGIALAIFLVIALRQALHYKSVLPVLFIVAGFCTVLLEPLIDNLGHGFHPEIGQINLFRAADRSIPIHIALIYSLYYGAMYVLMFPRIVNGGFTASYVWNLFWITCAVAYVFEIVPMQLGLWIYHDRQALWFWHGAMPPFFIFANAASILVPLTLIKLFYPILTGWKQWLVIPISPMGALMAHFGCGFPFYCATNSDASSFLVDLSGAVSIGLALMLTWGCAKLLEASTVSLFCDPDSTFKK